MATFPAAAGVTLGGKGATLSPAAVYALSLGLAGPVVAIDPSALHILSTSGPASSPRQTPAESISGSRAAAAVLLHKLLLTAADPSSKLVVTAATADALAAGSDRAALALTRDEAAVAAASAPASLALAATIDCCAAPLARLADAVAALSCEAARWDPDAALGAPASAKDEADVAADIKKLLLGSSNLAGAAVVSTAEASFAKVPAVHAIFREAARALGARVRTELNTPVKLGKADAGLAGEATEEALILRARILASSAHSMCKLSVARAGTIANEAGLREKLADGGINADDLKAMLDVVMVDLDAVSVLREVHGYLIKFREALAWEAAVAMAVIEMDSSIQKPHPDGEKEPAGSSMEKTQVSGDKAKGDIKSKKKKLSGKGTSSVRMPLGDDATDGKGVFPFVSSVLITDCSTEPLPPQASREKAKGSMKSEKKKRLGKGTSSVLMLLRDHVTDVNNVPRMDAALVAGWGTKLSLLFDPRCPKLDSLLKKVKEATERSEVKRLPKIPKGTRDFGREKMPIRRRAFSIIRDVFKMHGCVELDTPVFELRETLMGKYGEDSKLIYDLADQGGELCSLRYDLTVPFARYLAMNNISALRRYQIAKVYRRDNPSNGRYREFYQCDFDIAGVYELMEPDFEVIKVLTELLDKLDIGMYEIKLNHRKLLDGMLDICGVPPEKFRTVCSSIDKLDKLTFEEVKKELVEEKGVSNETAEKIGNLVNTRGPALEVLLELRKEGSKFMENDGSVVALNELEILFKALEKANAIDRICFDLSLARGLDYYTGVIYEAVFKGATQVGSIAAGGRYDNLVGSIIVGKKVPAVGVSLGIERVLEIMEQHAKEKDQAIRATETEVLLSILGKDLVLAAELVSELWSAGIKAEFKLRTRVMDHISYVKDSGIPWIVLVGANEMRDGKVKLKDIRASREEEVPIKDFVQVLKHRLGN